MGNWKPTGKGHYASGLVHIFYPCKALHHRPVLGALLANAFGLLSSVLSLVPPALLAAQRDCSGLSNPSIAQKRPHSALQSSTTVSQKAVKPLSSSSSLPVQRQNSFNCVKQ